MQRRTTTGHTLVELLITVVLVSMILVIGIPSFGDLLARQRQRAETQALFHAFHQAKKASISRNRVVSLCASSDGEQCNGKSDWTDGWILFVNEDNDQPPRRDPDEALLQRHVPGSYVRVQSNRRFYSLRSTRKRATNGTLVVCDTSGRIAAMAVVVNTFGRPRVTGENRYGSPYHCTD